MLDPNIFSKYKTKEDFDREAAEFDARKRQQEMNQQMGQLKLQQLQSQVANPKMGMEQLLAKSIQLGGSDKLSPQEKAQLQAFDIAQRTKQHVDARGNVVTNRSVFDMIPNGVGDMPPRDAMNMPIPGRNATPGFVPPSVPGSQIPAQNTPQDVAPQIPGGISEFPQNNIPPQNTAPKITIDPSAYGVTSPYAVEDIGKKAAEADISIQKQTAAEKTKTRGESLEDLAKVEGPTKQMLKTIGLLIDDSGKLQSGVGSAVGGLFGMQGRQASMFPLTSGQRRVQPILNQIKGQTFLQAYQSLKGGGTITEIEGNKAEAALARLDQYQSDEDFAGALNDLQDVLKSGLDRARSRAGVRQQGGATNIPMAAIQDLRSNPQTAAQFDQIFGQGASRKILGGQ